jgi:transposase
MIIKQTLPAVREESNELFSLREENRILKQENQTFQKRIENLTLEFSERLHKIEEENRRLKEENQQLRIKLFGFKSPQKETGEKSDDISKPPPAKLGPPIGHKGVSRPRPDRADRTVIVKPQNCPDCAGKLSGLKQIRERYMEDIVPVALFVTKYIIHQGYCKRCGKIVSPEVPEVIERCHFGLHFLLYITYLRYVMNLPDNKIVTLLNDTYEARVSEGTIVEYLNRAAKIFGSEYERIKDQMKQLNCHYDDTGQRVKGENQWLWVYISQEAVLYHTSRSRSKKVVIEILGKDYEGVTVQDFYPSYDQAPGLKQKCWAHLIRDARELMGQKGRAPPETEAFYEELRQIYKDAMEADKQPGLGEAERKEIYCRLVGRIKGFAEGNWQDEGVKRLCKRILKYREELFTFIVVPGIEPTNNRAERALRPCVVQRKVWGCHRTEQGAKNRDILMSVINTMKLQGQNILTQGKNYILTALT